MYADGQNKKNVGVDHMAHRPTGPIFGRRLHSRPSASWANPVVINLRIFSPKVASLSMFYVRGRKTECDVRGMNVGRRLRCKHGQREDIQAVARRPCQRGKVEEARRAEDIHFTMFNENQKIGERTEKHFGLFNPDKSPAYAIRF